MLHSNITRKAALNKEERERALYLSLYELMNRASTVGDEDTAFALASILAQDEHCPILYRAHAHMLLGLWLDAPDCLEHAREAIVMLEGDYYDELEADGRLQEFDREQVALAKRILRMAEEKAAAVERDAEEEIVCAGPD